MCFGREICLRPKRRSGIVVLQSAGGIHRGMRSLACRLENSGAAVRT